MKKNAIIALLVGAVLTLGSAGQAFAESMAGGAEPFLEESGEESFLEESGAEPFLEEVGGEPSRPSLTVDDYGIIVEEFDDGTVVKTTSGEAAEPRGGVIPVYADRLLESDPGESSEPALVGDAALPSSFRITNLPPVSDQGVYNVCWTYATLKGAETNLLKAGYGKGVDFAEYQLIYSIFHGGADTFLTKREWYDTTGSYMYTTAALAKNCGAADGRVYPYRAGELLSAEDMTNDIALVDHVVWPGSWPVDQAKWKGADWVAQTKKIKSLLVSEGAVMVSYNSSSARNTSYNSYYTAWTGTTKPQPDHAVLLIGWDDEKQTQAGKGAFYVMNSYGTNSSQDEKGFFWISYDDASLQDPAVFVMEAREPGSVKDPIALSHTGTGMNFTLRTTRQARIANIFTAPADLYVDRVGFYLPDTATYEVSLVTGMRNAASPDTGQVLANAAGKATYKGFYKADLSEPVRLAKGETFAVVATITTTDDGQTYRCVVAEGESKSDRTVSVGAGQSLYFNGTGWTDLSEGIKVTLNGAATTRISGNVCLYAYGREASPAAVLLGDTSLSGALDIDDLLLAARNLAGKKALTGKARRAADANQDGRENRADLFTISASLL